MKNNGFKVIMGSNELLNQSNFSVAHNGQAACWLENFFTDQEAHFQKTVILNSLVNMISFSFSFFLMMLSMRVAYKWVKHLCM